jgi:hypothetical protein
MNDNLLPYWSLSLTRLWVSWRCGCAYESASYKWLCSMALFMLRLCGVICEVGKERAT